MTPTFDEIEKMHDYIAGSAISSAIHVATKLKIADYLAKESLTVNQLSDHLQTDPLSLDRLMRALAGIGIFKEEVHEKKYSLTNMGSLIRSDVPNSMHDLIVMWGSEWHSDLWKGLEHSVKTDEPYFVKCFGMGFFEFIQKNPNVAKQFHSAMSSLSSLSNQAVADKIDFSKIHTVADIGGGEGGLLLAILNKWPNLNGILYDISSAIEKAKELFSRNNLLQRSQLIVGDFFKNVPELADAYILKHVLHGLDKSQGVHLLKNIKKSANSQAKIFIVEMVMPGPNTKCYSKFNDLEMMLFSSTGRERSIDDFTEMLNEAGLDLLHIKYVQMGLHIIEAIKQ